MGPTNEAKSCPTYKQGTFLVCSLVDSAQHTTGRIRAPAVPWVPIPAMRYPLIDNMLVCGGYFVEQLSCDSAWSINEPEKLLEAAEEWIAKYETHCMHLNGFFLYRSVGAETLASTSSMGLSPLLYSRKSRISVLQMIIMIIKKYLHLFCLCYILTKLFRYPNIFSNRPPFSQYPVLFAWCAENISSDSLPCTVISSRFICDNRHNRVMICPRCSLS